MPGTNYKKLETGTTDELSTVKKQTPGDAIPKRVANPQGWATRNMKEGEAKAMKAFLFYAGYYAKGVGLEDLLKDDAYDKRTVNAVIAFQKDMRKAGFYKGPIDGLFGTGSKGAFKRQYLSSSDYGWDQAFHATLSEGNSTIMRDIVLENERKDISLKIKSGDFSTDARLALGHAHMIVNSSKSGDSSTVEGVSSTDKLKSKPVKKKEAETGLKTDMAGFGISARDAEYLIGVYGETKLAFLLDDVKSHTKPEFVKHEAASILRMLIETARMGYMFKLNEMSEGSNYGVIDAVELSEGRLSKQYTQAELVCNHWLKAARANNELNTITTGNADEEIKKFGFEYGGASLRALNKADDDRKARINRYRTRYESYYDAVSTDAQTYLDMLKNGDEKAQSEYFAIMAASVQFYEMLASLGKIDAGAGREDLLLKIAAGIISQRLTEFVALPSEKDGGVKAAFSQYMGLVKGAEVSVDENEMKKNAASALKVDESKIESVVLFCGGIAPAEGKVMWDINSDAVLSVAMKDGTEKTMHFRQFYDVTNSRIFYETLEDYSIFASFGASQTSVFGHGRWGKGSVNSEVPATEIFESETKKGLNKYKWNVNYIFAQEMQKIPEKIPEKTVVLEEPEFSPSFTYRYTMASKSLLVSYEGIYMSASFDVGISAAPDLLDREVTSIPKGSEPKNVSVSYFPFFYNPDSGELYVLKPVVFKNPVPNTRDAWEAAKLEKFTSGGNTYYNVYLSDKTKIGVFRYDKVAGAPQFSLNMETAKQKGYLLDASSQELQKTGNTYSFKVPYAPPEAFIIGGRRMRGKLLPGASAQLNQDPVPVEVPLKYSDVLSFVNGVIKYRGSRPDEMNERALTSLGMDFKNLLGSKLSDAQVLELYNAMAPYSSEGWTPTWFRYILVEIVPLARKRGLVN
ncbi:MAG: peptidoglycan-binding domain-containing protein [Candidatus Bilamarchaeaceae archaeon]